MSEGSGAGPEQSDQAKGVIRPTFTREELEKRAQQANFRPDQVGNSLPASSGPVRVTPETAQFLEQQVQSQLGSNTRIEGMQIGNIVFKPSTTGELDPQTQVSLDAAINNGGKLGDLNIRKDEEGYHAVDPQTGQEMLFRVTKGGEGELMADYDFEPINRTDSFPVRVKTLDDNLWAYESGPGEGFEDAKMRAALNAKVQRGWTTAAEKKALEDYSKARVNLDRLARAHRKAVLTQTADDARTFKTSKEENWSDKARATLESMFKFPGGTVFAGRLAVVEAENYIRQYRRTKGSNYFFGPHVGGQTEDTVNYLIANGLPDIEAAKAAEIAERIFRVTGEAENLGGRMLGGSKGSKYTEEEKAAADKAQASFFGRFFKLK